MEQIVRDEEIQVIDFFSGCGGMSLGVDALRQAGVPVRLVGGVDINPVSLATYEQNFGVPGVRQDVRELAAAGEADFSNFLSKLDRFEPEKPLLVIGCAPCQGFSAHTKTNMKKVDARNDLVTAFAHVARRLNPRVVVMENVPELLKGRFSGFFDSFKSVLGEAGYDFAYEVHNAAEYGTPQKRMRALVISSRVSQPWLPTGEYSANDYRTVRDAIHDLPEVGAGEVYESDHYHRSARHRPSTLDVIASVPLDGGSRPRGMGPECLDKVKGFTDVYGRLAWDKPSITITHYARNPASGRFTHPTQNRGLTMREVARLQSFPDAFGFTGGSDDVFRQIGEAVPPLLSVGVVSAAYAQSMVGSSHATFGATE